MDVVDDILTHFGAKGMRWGVRKVRSIGGPTDVTVREVAGKKGIGLKTSGGKHQPASEDAKSTAGTKQKARASGTHSLSNDEMQKAIARMNLELTYTRLTKPPENGVKKFVKKLLGDTAQSEVKALSQGKEGPIMNVVKTGLAAKSAKAAGKHAAPRVA